MSNEPTTLAAIREQATEDGTWVNGPFEAIVKNAKAGQTPGNGNKAKPSKCCLVDPKDPNTTLNACWFGGSFLKYEDKVIRVSGKGTKVSVYNSTPEVNIGKDAIVDIIGNAPAQAGPTPGAQTGPRDDSRGGNNPPPPAKPHDDPVTHFHKEMKKTALLWAHCFQYTVDTEAKLGVVLPPDQFQSLTTSLFMTAKERDLRGNAPAPRKKTADGKTFEPYVAPKPDPALAEEQERKRREALEAEALRLQEEARRKAAHPHENLDEDVPF